MENPQDQTSPTNENNVSEIPAIPEASNIKEPKKSKKPFIIGGILLAIPLILLASLAAKEYFRASNFVSGVNKAKSESYLKNIHTYLESNGGEYVNYRSCNVTSTDELWSFKQPEDAKYYYSDFSMIYNELEGKLRGEQSDVKKNMPAEYKKNAFSGIARGLDHSIQKRQQMLDLTSSMEVLFNNNDYIDYCSRVIYQNTIDRLSRIKVNADGSNTVVSGSATDFDKKQAEELVKTLESQKVPVGFEQVHQEFLKTLKAIAATYGEASRGSNTSESVKKYREAFQAHKASLDKNLKDLAGAAKQKVTVQPSSISEQLKAVEE